MKMLVLLGVLTMLVGCATAPPVQRWDSVNQRVVTEPSIEDKVLDWVAILNLIP